MYVLILLFVLVVAWHIFSKKKSSKTAPGNVDAKVSALYKKWNEYSQENDKAAELTNLETWIRNVLGMSDDTAWDVALQTFKEKYPKAATKLDADEALEPTEIQRFFNLLISAYLVNKPDAYAKTEESGSNGKTALALGLLASAISVKNNVDKYKAHKERLDEIEMISDSKRREKNAKTDAERLAERRHREQLEATLRLKKR